MNDIKRIDIKEFREKGFLQEANRLFFHPLGLALEVVIEEDGSERLGGVWDSRDDPEGIAFGGEPGSVIDRENIERVAQEHRKHAEARRILFAGDWVQGPGEELAG